MKIEWFGNSSFLLKTSLGKRIFIDPFNILNTFQHEIIADIITLSKNISLSTINPQIKLLRCDESYNDEFIKITGYSTYGDNVNGLRRGKNYVYVYEVDNLKICHLGYIGEMPNDEIIKLLKNCDLLFLPIGGNLCLNGSLAYKLCEYISPKYIIPMCYKITNCDFYFQGPKEFISYSKKILLHKESSIDLSSLPSDCKNLTLLLNCK